MQNVIKALCKSNAGGYFFSGFTNSLDLPRYHESYLLTYDMWVGRVDVNGALLWNKCLGGTDYDQAYSICPTTDGGCVVAGYAGSNNGDVTGKHVYRTNTYMPDYWIIKLDAAGTIEWKKCFGGYFREVPYSICQTSDGRYVVAGYADSNDGDVSGFHAGSDPAFLLYDYWVVKFDNAGI